MQVTVEEISMVGTQMLNLVNNHCCMVKYKNPEGKDFGKINMSHFAYVCKTEGEKRNLLLNFDTCCKV